MYVHVIFSKSERKNTQNLLVMGTGGSTNERESERSYSAKEI